MPSSLVHALLPAGCAAYEARTRPMHWRARLFLTCMVIGNLPDLDLVVGLCIPQHFNDLHRNLGHNLFIFPFWVALAAWLLQRWGAPWLSIRKRWLVALVLVFSHHLCDAMTERGVDAPGLRSTVPLFWPVSTKGWELPFALFHGVPPQHLYPNPLLDRILSRTFWLETIFVEFFWTAVLLMVWIALRETQRWIQKARARSEDTRPSITNKNSARSA